jgi:hypothetical protein
MQGGKAEEGKDNCFRTCVRELKCLWFAYYGRGSHSVRVFQVSDFSSHKGGLSWPSTSLLAAKGRPGRMPGKNTPREIKRVKQDIICSFMAKSVVVFKNPNSMGSF